MSARTFTHVVTAKRLFGNARRAGVIELTIDTEKLATMLADKAFYNKSKASRLAYGLICAKAHSIQELQP